jgi:hypothetical protein
MCNPGTRCLKTRLQFGSRLLFREPASGLQSTTRLIIIELQLSKRGQRRQVFDLLDQVPAEAQRLNLPQLFQVFDLADAAVVLEQIC